MALRGGSSELGEKVWREGGIFVTEPAHLCPLRTQVPGSFPGQTQRFHTCLVPFSQVLPAVRTPDQGWALPWERIHFLVWASVPAPLGPHMAAHQKHEEAC